MDKTGLGAVLASLLLCLPCLLVAVGAAGGVVLVSGAAAWIADNSIIAIAGLLAAAVTAGAIFAYRRRCAAACEIQSDSSRKSQVAGTRR